ncbi:hypothetical protein PVAP13_3KG504800 [Panicum virgatum]|uniref:Uncharacterized protein n=1 Tax=Panicum virgatum TaxID=38727 RepID=A0A8T0V454_PANVG|nr:hypothetical protein PVAP13_3KG504800 [Panicum virgatum]
MPSKRIISVAVNYITQQCFAKSSNSWQENRRSKRRTRRAGSSTDASVTEGIISNQSMKVQRAQTQSIKFTHSAIHSTKNRKKNLDYVCVRLQAWLAQLHAADCDDIKRRGLG